MKETGNEGGHGGKVSKWADFIDTAKWLVKRLICKHPNAKFAKKAGNMSKFTCADCDGFFFRRNSWSDLE